MLATAGLAALRSEDPSLEWHTWAATYSAHESLAAVEEGVPSGYQKQARCLHASRLTGNGRAPSAPKRNLGHLIKPRAYSTSQGRRF